MSAQNQMLLESEKQMIYKQDLERLSEQIDVHCQHPVALLKRALSKYNESEGLYVAWQKVEYFVTDQSDGQKFADTARQKIIERSEDCKKLLSKACQNVMKTFPLE